MHRREIIVPPLLLLLLAGAVIAANQATVSVNFNGSNAVRFNPLAFTSNQTIFPGVNATVSFSNIITVNVLKTTATITIVTTATGTSTMFSGLSCVLSFNSTTVTINGLMSGTTSLSLAKGTYILSDAVTYASLINVADGSTASLAIGLTGK